MQIFRIVKGGFTDKVIGFDSLPKSMLSGIGKGSIDGFARHWKKWFEDVAVDEYRKDGTGPFYILDYFSVNKDKEKWQEISNYVRRATDKNFRLLDKLEDMAIPMAEDSHKEMTLQPEDIVIVPIVSEDVVNETKEEKPEPLVKRRGRPGKVHEAVPV